MRVQFIANEINLDLMHFQSSLKKRTSPKEQDGKRQTDEEKQFEGQN
jgi:hypothetical protein